jgi:hypothetical protein
MESQTSTVVHKYTPGVGSVRAKVERGQRGGYAWELSIEVPRQSSDEGYAAAFERASAALTEADRTMGCLFGAPAADLTVSPTRVARAIGRPPGRLAALERDVPGLAARPGDSAPAPAGCGGYAARSRSMSPARWLLGGVAPRRAVHYSRRARGARRRPTHRTVLVFRVRRLPRVRPHDGRALP